MDLAGLVSVIEQNKANNPQSVMADMANSSVGVGRDYVYSAVRNRFKNPALQSAILASIEHETGGSFNPFQKQYGGGKGRGLIQMEGQMLDGYKKYLNTTKMPDGVDSQLDYLNNIMSNNKYYDIGSGHRQRLQEAINTNDPNVILKEFTNRVERPGKPLMDRRIEALNRWSKIIGITPSEQIQQVDLQSDFDKAFAKARKEGLKVFEFNGKKYNTEVK